MLERDGTAPTLLTVFARADFEFGVGELHAARSLDDGLTWLPAVQFASQPIQTFFDPEGEALPQPQFPKRRGRRRRDRLCRHRG